MENGELFWAWICAFFLVVILVQLYIICDFYKKMKKMQVNREYERSYMKETLASVPHEYLEEDMSERETNLLNKKFMDKVTNIVKENLDNAEFNVNQFASEMAIARTKLFVRLKEITGQTPNEFILTMRMTQAASYLKTRPELSISEISDMTGFSSPRYFSRIFKKRYQMTPQTYRRGNDSETDENPMKTQKV